MSGSRFQMHFSLFSLICQFGCTPLTTYTFWDCLNVPLTTITETNNQFESNLLLLLACLITEEYRTVTYFQRVQTVIERQKTQQMTL